MRSLIAGLHQLVEPHGWHPKLANRGLGRCAAWESGAGRLTKPRCVAVHHTLAGLDVPTVLEQFRVFLLPEAYITDAQVNLSDLKRQGSA